MHNSTSALIVTTYSSLDSKAGLNMAFQTRRNVKILIEHSSLDRNWHMTESLYSEKSGENYGLKLYMPNIFFIY